MKGVNLIPQSLRQQRRRARRVRRWSVSCVAYAAGLLVTCAAMRAMYLVDRHTLASDIVSTAKRIDEANKSLVGLRLQLSELTERTTTVQTIIDQPDWSILMAALGAATDDDLVLRELRLGSIAQLGPVVRPTGAPERVVLPKRFQLSLRGVGSSSGAVARFVNKLEQTQFFD